MYPTAFTSGIAILHMSHFIGSPKSGLHTRASAHKPKFYSLQIRRGLSSHNGESQLINITNHFRVIIDYHAVMYNNVIQQKIFINKKKYFIEW